MDPNIINEIIQTVYPDDIKCIVCGAEIRPNRYGLCGKCTLMQNGNFCVRCGRHKVGLSEYCSECGGDTLYFDEARSSVIYDGSAKLLVRRLKYGSAKYLAKSMSEFMLDTLVVNDWDFDCFTFVPMHEKRQKRRGYNQAELIANAIAARTTTPCIPLLQKVKQTPNQARLDRAARIKNLDGSFAAPTTPPDHVVIVDDVMTTGSTLNECAKVLKRAGATVVYALTFASVPERPLTDRRGAHIQDFRRE